MHYVICVLLMQRAADVVLTFQGTSFNVRTYRASAVLLQAPVNDNDVISPSGTA